MTPDLADWLTSAGAANDVVTWAREQSAGPQGWEQAWLSCPRGDWLLGIAARLGVSREVLARITLELVSTTPKTMHHELVRTTVQVCQRVLEEPDEHRVAAQRSRVDAVADPAQLPAGIVASALLDGLDDPAAFASVPSALFQLELMSGRQGADPMQLMLSHQKRAAQLVRQQLPWGEMKSLVARLG